MHIHRIIALIRKEFTCIVREPALLFMLFIFPIVLTLTFGFSFGALGSQETTYNVVVINQDPSSTYSVWFIGNLTEVEILEVELMEDAPEALRLLQNGELSAIIRIPLDFTISIESFLTSPTNTSLWVNTTLEVQYDAGSMVVAQLLPPVIQQTLYTSVFGPQTAQVILPVQLGTISVETEQKTMFDYFAPGFFAFSILFITMIVAQQVSGEKSKGLLKRIHLTPTTAGDLMLGLSCAYVLIAFIQSVLVLLMAVVMGYTVEGGLGIAILFVSLFSLSSVGFGLITGAVSKNEGMATGLSFLFIIPQMFLGTFVSSGPPRLINKLVPSYYITHALTSLFLRGASPFSLGILQDLGILTAYCVIVFILGLLAFRWFIRK